MATSSRCSFFHVSRLKFPLKCYIIKVSAKVQPSITVDCENVNFMPTIEVGSQTLPFDKMGMTAGGTVSVIDVNYPWSSPFDDFPIIRRDDNHHALTACMKMQRKKKFPRADLPCLKAWKLMLQMGYTPHKGLGRKKLESFFRCQTRWQRWIGVIRKEG